MIGIGVTTYKRPAVFKLWWSQLIRPVNSFVAHHIDTFGKGIAYAKNQCLEKLQDCEHIFLFDDDCFPIQENWWEPYIEAAKKGGNNHLLYLTDRNTDLKQTAITNDGIVVYDKPLGCMMYMTRKAVQTVGAFDVRFKKYGYEHINYSQRIFQAGLNPSGPYLGIPDPQPIYSMDVDGPGEYLTNFRSSIAGENVEFWKERNLYLLNQPIEECYLPL
jgi:hypothetical protein